MANTQRMTRRVSLSLNRLTSNSSGTRRIGSPQNLLRPQRNSTSKQQQNDIANGRDSPQSSFINSGFHNGAFQTPPHRKPNWGEESVDYSPRSFDNSFSPDSLFSQTMAIDSGEVGWRWSEATPDSAYTDNSFKSGGSSSTEAKAVRTTAEARRQRSALAQQRIEERRIREIEFCKAEKARANEVLKQRCALLQQQLSEAGTLSKEKENTHKVTIKESKQKSSTLTILPILEPSTTIKTNNLMVSTHDSANSDKPHLRKLQKTPITTSLSTQVRKTKSSPAVHSNVSKSIDDFFNDSDSDLLLVAASQQIETTTAFDMNTANEPLHTPEKRKKFLVSSTPPSGEAKRSSLYMKFFEDDIGDDWFTSIDEVIAEATQSKKPRTSFQRYKSMPSPSTTASTISTNTFISSNSKVGSSAPQQSKGVDQRTTRSTSSAIMKRHSSSQCLSPSVLHRKTNAIK